MTTLAQIVYEQYSIMLSLLIAESKTLKIIFITEKDLVIAIQAPERLIKYCSRNKMETIILNLIMKVTQ